MSAFKQTKQFQTRPSKKGEGEDKHSHAHGLPVRNANIAWKMFENI